MRSLVLAVLLLTLLATPAAAQVSVADPADTPGSVYDIESLTVGYDPAGTVRLTWRLHQPFPDAPPADGPAYLSANVLQQQEYSLGCRAVGDPGDLLVVLDYSAPNADPPAWDAGYLIFPRDGLTAAPVQFSADRREVTVTISDPLVASRPYFCVSAMSEDGVRDDTDAAYFPGFAPLAPVLLGPADGAVLRGTTPELGWETRPSSGEWFELWKRDPATGGEPLLLADPAGRDGRGDIVGTRTATGFRLAKPLAEGVYWWGVTRQYGQTALKAYKRFEVGPPELTQLTLSRRVRAPKSRSRRGKAQLTIKATRGASGTLVVKRGSRTVKTFKYSIKTDATRPKLTLPLSCAAPGRYTATARASDRYGRRRQATTSWTVSGTPCLSR